MWWNWQIDKIARALPYTIDGDTDKRENFE